MKKNYRYFVICLVNGLFLSRILIVYGKRRGDGWYQQCEGGEECAYTGAKSTATCFDSNERCREFALSGECKANPTWMFQNCRKSCGLCVPTVDGDEDNCKDLHGNCPLWASELECFLNPGYMSRACPKSCWSCVNITELKELKTPEEEIQRRVRFSQTDFGLWQAIPENEDADQVRDWIQNMARYVQGLNNTGPGTVCNNIYHECAQWAVTQGCETELEFMLSSCSLACQYCDVIETYHTCRGLSSNKVEMFGTLEMTFNKLVYKKKAKDLLEGYLEDREDGEWVLSLEKTALWPNDNPEGKSQQLVAILKSDTDILIWRESSSENYTNFQSDVVPERSGRSAICGVACLSHPAMANLQTSIAKLLQIRTDFFQSFEFVHYKRGERFAAHHDFRLHDRWRNSGERVMTVFIALQSPSRGGSFGFPELDWLLVDKPQMLLWPNMAASDPTQGLKRMKSEQLPVVEGEMYGVYTWVRRHPFNEEDPCA